MLTFQIAAGLLLAAFVALVTTKGMNIHRSNDGWRSLFGGGLFLLGFLIGGAVIVAGATMP